MVFQLIQCSECHTPPVTLTAHCHWSVFALRDVSSEGGLSNGLLLTELVRCYIESGDALFMEPDSNIEWDRVLVSVLLRSDTKGVDGVLRHLHGALEPGGYFVSLLEKTPDETGVFPLFGDHDSDSRSAVEDISVVTDAIAESAIQLGFHWVLSRVLETPRGPLAVTTAKR